jgi:hypothetical protein
MPTTLDSDNVLFEFNKQNSYVSAGEDIPTVVHQDSLNA